MQDVSSAFTAEERASARHVASNLLVSWKKETTLGGRTFTIGVSTIGDTGFIGINPGAVGSPGNYRYFDESDYVTQLAWERRLNMPLGGLVKGLAEATLENTSGRFTPRYGGGSSELFTAILPRRPFIINAGFNVDGIDATLPQFSGILTRQPEVLSRERSVKLVGADYVDFFQNRFLDHEAMVTGMRTDEIYEDMLQSMGLSTGQYSLDPGINVIPFALFEKGTKLVDIFNGLAQAENGHFYQDEEGIFRFENRQHWDSSPHNSVSRIVLTGQVIDSEIPDDDHIVNVVEIRSSPRSKQPRQTLFKLASPVEVLPSKRTEIFVDFEDPVLAVDTITITTNIQEDGSGATANIWLDDSDIFSKAAKLIFKGTQAGFVTSIEIFGRPARVMNDIYVRAVDDSSLTAYEERNIIIDNDYIQSEDWASSYAQMILNDLSDAGRLQTVTVLAMPSLQIGDLVSWQGRWWRLYGIRSRLSAGEGFIQELDLLQRDVLSYFRIGISTIGGSDQIAP